MRVCLVGPAYPYRGGIAHFTSMLAKEFEKEHEVLIVNFTRLYPSFLFPGKTQYDDSESPLRVESRRIIDSLNPYSFLQAGRTIVRYAPDFVVFQWWQPFFGPAFRVICSVIKRKLDSKIVFLCHNVLPHESSVFDRVLANIGLSRADAFLVQSNEDAQTLKRIKGSPVVGLNPHPVYDFFDENRFDRKTSRQKLGLDSPTLLFFGYVRGYKGLGVLLDAFALVRKRLDATLLVVGEFYDKKEPYDEKIAKLDLGKNVRIVDKYVPNEDVEMYFKASDLVVLPYLSATQSGIVQTAYSFEKPVVVTAVGGLPDVVEDGKTGYVVEPNDPVGLGDAILRFFDGKDGERMAGNIRAAADRFTWKHCTRVLAELGGMSGKGVENL